jgi:hypothetical protein
MTVDVRLSVSDNFVRLSVCLILATLHLTVALSLSAPFSLYLSLSLSLPIIVPSIQRAYLFSSTHLFTSFLNSFFINSSLLISSLLILSHINSSHPIHPLEPSPPLTGDGSLSCTLPKFCLLYTRCREMVYTSHSV